MNRSLSPKGGPLAFFLGVEDTEAFLKRYRLVRKLSPENLVEIEALPSGSFHVSDADGEVVVGRRERLRQYKNGVAKRRERLVQEYILDDVPISQGDLVVDCGANIGEVSMILRSRGAKVVSFEPDPVEFAALNANAAREGNIEPVQKGLWHETGELSFYQKNETGDSSLFDPGDTSGEIKIAVTSLDDHMAQFHPDQRIRLVKLEAEGAEPEILQGMVNSLPHIDYVVVDMGPERGVAQENTVPAVVTALHSHGFDLIEFREKRLMGLFRARHISARQK